MKMLLPLMLCLVACGSPDAPTEPAASAAADRQKTVLDPQIDAYNRAKDVEKQMQTAADERAEAIRKQGG